MLNFIKRLISQPTSIASILLEIEGKKSDNKKVLVKKFNKTITELQLDYYVKKLIELGYSVNIKSNTKNQFILTIAWEYENRNE